MDGWMGKGYSEWMGRQMEGRVYVILHPCITRGQGIVAPKVEPQRSTLICTRTRDKKCPSSYAMSLRRGWSQPGVKDTYGRCDNAGDEHFAGVVTGISMHPQTVEDEAFIHQCVDVANVNVGVARMCLASIIYHFDELKRCLPPNHQLWTDCIITNGDLCTRLKSLEFCGYVDDNEAQRMSLHCTGVPPIALCYAPKAQ
eukprot:scaffold818_cov388-Pavlova_lutheri.AAC.13